MIFGSRITFIAEEIYLHFTDHLSLSVKIRYLILLLLFPTIELIVSHSIIFIFHYFFVFSTEIFYDSPIPTNMITSNALRS